MIKNSIDIMIGLGFVALAAVVLFAGIRHISGGHHDKVFATGGTAVFLAMVVILLMAVGNPFINKVLETLGLPH